MDQKILFLHIPKSAGTTLTHCLTQTYYNKHAPEEQTTLDQDMDRFYQGDIFYYPLGFFKDPPNRFPDYTLPYLRIPNLKVITGHFSYGIHRFIPSKCMYISILRDPVKRILSLFYHLISMKIISETTSLDQFLEGLADECWLVELMKWHPVISDLSEKDIRNHSKNIVDNDQTRRISGMEPGFGQCDETMFHIAKQNIENDFLLVGLTEQFDETLLLLSHKLGWKNVLNYIPKLINKSKPEPKTLPDRILYKIEQTNYWDLKLFEYAQKTFDKEVKQLGLMFKEQLNRYSQANKQFVESSKNAEDWNIG